MSTFVAGSASVRISPDLTGFHRKVKASLRSERIEVPVNVVPNMGQFKQKLESGLGRVRAKFKVDVSPDMSGFAAELRTKLGANGAAVKIPVRLDFTQAHAQLAAFRAVASRPLHIRVDLDVGGAVAQLGALRGATEGVGAASGGLRSAANGVGSIGSSAAGMLNPVKLATSALAALAAVSMIPLIGQLAQAAGVISLLPAVAAAAAAGIATIVIGSTGVFDAFSKGAKAADAAGKGAAATAKAQASAARNVASAQDGIARSERGVQQAQKQSERAQESLTRARKDAQEQIEDLNLSLKGSALDERSAVAAVKRAERSLRELGKDGQSFTPLDMEEAVIGVDEAKHRLDEVRERNQDLQEEVAAANKAGVEGSDKVVAAKEAVADAELGVVDAQKSVIDSHQQLVDAQAAATESTSAGAAAVDEYADALANLSPEARKFVEQTRGLGGVWRDLRLAVQDNLFTGLGDSITTLANQAFPTLKTGLGGIATEINGGLRRALDDLSSESTKLDWTKILDNTKAAIGPVIDGLSNLWGSLTNIAAIGSEFLPGFGDSFSNVMKEFRAWTESPDGQNKIRDFMNESIDALGDIKDLFVELGRVVGGLFQTSEETGESMIESLTRNLREFADWMRTEEGQKQMKQFWDDIRTTITDILTLIKEATKMALKIDEVYRNITGRPSKEEEERQQKDRDERGIVPNTQHDPDDSNWGRRFRDKDGNTVDSKGNRLRWQNNRIVGFPGVREGSVADKGFNWLENSFDPFGWIRGGNTTDGEARPAREGSPRTGMSDQDTLDRLSIPSGGGRSAGKKVTRDEWIALFGNAEEFDRILAEQKAKQDKYLADSESRYQRFGTNVAGILDGLTAGGFTRFTDALSELGRKILGTTEDGKINWGSMGARFGEVATHLVDVTFPGLRGGLQNVKDFAGAVVEGFNGDWSKLKGYAIEPINWIIENVINGVLKNAWNTVAGVIPGLKSWDGVAPIQDAGAGKGEFGKELKGYHSGGIIPGYTPGVDTTTIGVGGGEAVMRPEWTRAMGSEYVHGMNAAARHGGVEGVKRRMQYFKDGGIVSTMTDAVQEKFGTGMQMTSGLRFTDDGYHSKGMAADFSDGSASTPAMRQLAGWIADNFAGKTIELIHDPFGRNIGAGNPVGDGYGFYGADTMAEHNNHVHWALDGLVGGGGAVGQADGGGILGGAKRVLGGAANSARNAAAGAFEKAASALGGSIPDFGPSLMGGLPRAAFNGIKDAMSAAIRGSGSGSLDSGTTPFDVGAGVEQWRGKVVEALKREGFDAGERNQQLMLAQIQSESSGNPNAVQQVQDVNSGGNEAVGLLQVIPGTFATNRNPDLPNDRTDPDASMSAALRYYRSRYGEDLGAVWGQGHGYANGGIIPGYTPGRDKFSIGVGGGEAVMRPEWTRGVGSAYVDHMNAVARTQGVAGVKRAQGMFANGGIVDPRLFAMNRFAQYGQELGGIAKSAIPEILGVTGTPLDPNHRYWKAAMDIQSAVQGAGAANNQMANQKMDNYLSNQRVGSNQPQPAPMPTNTFVFNGMNEDSAVEKTRLMLKQQALTFTRR